MQEGLPKEVKKNVLKDIIKRLHEGEPISEIKSQFRAILSHVTTTEITEIEEELINEGLKREEILKLCDLHTELFKEAIENEQTLAPIGHPIFILMKEHRLMLELTEKLKIEVERCRNKGKDNESISDISKHMTELKSAECHYLREENVLFSFLEKHGVTEPPKIMWMEHDKIREVKKEIFSGFDVLKENFSETTLEQIKNSLTKLHELQSSHFYKENNILFNAAMRLISQDEWLQIYREFIDIGFTSFYIPEFWKDAITVPSVSQMSDSGKEIVFNTGQFNLSELESLLNTIPFDITFVDSDDKVRYFSDSKHRIFVRTKAILGRTVQQCHPAKSVHVVNKILENFRTGKRDSESFWINLGGKLILIQYFAVRDKSGKYLGCVEVSKDITELKKIEGEKRLLEE